MDKKELKYAINQHPDIVYMRKVMAGVLIIWLVVSILLLIILPVAGIIGLALWPVLYLLYAIALGGRKKRIRKYAEQNGIDWEVAPKGSTRRPSTVGFSDADVQMNGTAQSDPVANAAASYVIGKAVQKAMNLQPEKRILFDPRYSKTCATCEYWGGERSIEKQANLPNASCRSKQEKGRCSNKNASHMFYDKTRVASDGCKGWGKWSSL